MPMRRYVFILEETIDGTSYNHGTVTSAVAIMEARFANEPGHNGDLFDQWIADGRIDQWYFVDNELPIRRFVPEWPTDWVPTDSMVGVFEDTDYLVSMYFDAGGVDGYNGEFPGWTIMMLQTDRDYPPEFFTQIGVPYDLSMW